MKWGFPVLGYYDRMCYWYWNLKSLGGLRLSELGSFSEHCPVSPISALSSPITLPMAQVSVSSPNNGLKKNPQGCSIKRRDHWVTRSSRLQMVIDLFKCWESLLVTCPHKVSSRKNHLWNRDVLLIDQICWCLIWDCLAFRAVSSKSTLFMNYLLYSILLQWPEQTKIATSHI